MDSPELWSVHWTSTLLKEESEFSI